VAINDVLPLKTAGRNVIANLKCFFLGGGAKHQRSNFNGFIYIHYAAPPYSARISAIYTSSRLAKFGWVPIADLRVQRLAMKQNAEFTEGW